MKEPLVERRSRIKTELVIRRGGQCKSCGYKKSYSALCFHHKDHTQKEFNISGVRLTGVSRKRLEAEADKCDVYCLNCHAELHDIQGWIHEDGKSTPKKLIKKK